MYGNCQTTKEELQEIVDGYEKAGFTGYRGCLDCMKLKWKNCPFVEKGQSTTRMKVKVLQ